MINFIFGKQYAEWLEHWHPNPEVRWFHTCWPLPFYDEFSNYLSISYTLHATSYILPKKKDSNLAWDSACIRHIFKDNDTNWVCKAYFLIWMWKCASHKKLPMNLNVNCTRNISICKQWHNYKYELVGLMQN